MKQIEKDELFDHVSTFFKDKGVELKEGVYTRGVRMGCQFLADAINLSQEGVQRARNQFDKTLAQMRQVIHEKTAPKSAKRKSSSQKTRAKARNSKSGRRKRT
ncbi:MAG: hypothetical protein C5B50_00215 [Verrucomicrobia bacterium]|nr:MAG: hypothetical protein C5B50_00215 [Verrucomicrobiota bacterium]